MAQVWACKYAAMVDWRLAQLADCAPAGQCAGQLLKVARTAKRALVQSDKQEAASGDSVKPSLHGAIGKLLEASIGSLELLRALVAGNVVNKRLRKLLDILGLGLVAALELYASSGMAIQLDAVCTRARQQDLALVCSSINSLPRPAVHSLTFISDYLIPLCIVVWKREEAGKCFHEPNYLRHFEAAFRELEAAPPAVGSAAIHLELLIWRSVEHSLFTNTHQNERARGFIESQFVSAEPSEGTSQGQQAVSLTLLARIVSTAALNDKRAVERLLALVFVVGPPVYGTDVMLQLRRLQLAHCLATLTGPHQALERFANTIADHLFGLLAQFCVATNHPSKAAWLAKLILNAYNKGLNKLIEHDQTIHGPLEVVLMEKLVEAYARSHDACLIEAINCLLEAHGPQDGCTRARVSRIVGVFIEHDAAREVCIVAGPILQLVHYGLARYMLSGERALRALQLVAASSQVVQNFCAHLAQLADTLELLAAHNSHRHLAESAPIGALMDALIAQLNATTTAPSRPGPLGAHEGSRLVHALVQLLYCSNPAELYKLSRLTALRALLARWRGAERHCVSWLVLIMARWPTELKRCAPVGRWFVELIERYNDDQNARAHAQGPAPATEALVHFEWRMAAVAATLAMDATGGFASSNKLTLAVSLDAWLASCEALGARLEDNIALAHERTRALASGGEFERQWVTSVESTLTAACHTLTRLLNSPAHPGRTRRNIGQARELTAFLVRCSERADDLLPCDLPAGLVAGARRRAAAELGAALSKRQGRCNILN